jgi:hypothetical protein
MSTTRIRSTIAIATVAIAIAVVALPRHAEARPPASLPADLVTETIYRPYCQGIERDSPKEICESGM